MSAFLVTHFAFAVDVEYWVWIVLFTWHCKHYFIIVLMKCLRMFHFHSILNMVMENRRLHYLGKAHKLHVLYLWWPWWPTLLAILIVFLASFHNMSDVKPYPHLLLEPHVSVWWMPSLCSMSRWPTRTPKISF
jgi:hypothetical protein